MIRVDDIGQYYRWSKVLGGGAFGEVHKAVNLKSNGECAIKIYQKRSIEFNPNSETLKQQLTEELTQL